jgi:hypothetical protein
MQVKHNYRAAGVQLLLILAASNALLPTWVGASACAAQTMSAPSL